MNKIIAIANQKGGVGKTTTAINLSSALSHFGKKTLLIDMDPQGNAGRGLGIDITLLRKTVFECMDDGESVVECLIHTQFDGLDLLPANLRLAALEASILQKGTENPFSLLKNSIAPIKEDYDYVIIDCPPSLGGLCLNSLVAADFVLIPVQCEYFAMEALAAMLSSISNVQNDLNPDLKIEGFLLTMYDSRTKLGTEVSTEVRKIFKENTFLVSIPRNQSISESQARQMPVTIFRPSSQGSMAYFSLAREIIDHERE